VWSRLTEIYGQNWERNHGEVPPNGWIIRIGELSDRQIRRGLEALSLTEEKFYPVPDLAVFSNYCARGADRTEKFCLWPQFDGIQVGIPQMNDLQWERYLRADYDNVDLHRAWITDQPFFKRGQTPEYAVKRVMDMQKEQENELR